MTKSAKKSETKRGGWGPRALGQTVARIARPLLGKRGFADGAIVTHWPDIVGATVAAHCAPMKIAFPRGGRDRGTLHLKVDGGSFAAELQHLEPMLIERINGYFGYRAVEKVRLVQGPLPPRPSRPVDDRPDLDPRDEAAIDRDVASVEDPELKEILARLGRDIRRREAAKKDG